MATKLLDGGQVLSPLEEMSASDYVSYLPTERAQRFFNAIAPAEEGDSVQETMKSHNVLVAPFGAAPPFTLSKPYSRVISIRTDVECAKPVNIKSHAMVDGITFTSTADLDSEMVLVSGGGTSLLRNCTFVLTESSTVRACVKVSAPAKVIFVGCYFVRQSGAGGAAINNTAADTDVMVVGCIATGYAGFGDAVPSILPANIIGSFV